MNSVVVTAVEVLNPLGFDPAAYITEPRRLRSMNRTFQLGTSVAVAAWQAAGLPSPSLAPERAGVAAAVTDLSPITPDLLRTLETAGIESWADFAESALHQLHPFRRLTLLANMAAAHTSLLLNLQGPSFTLTSGPSAAAQALREAYFTISTGAADLMLCQTAQSPEQTFTSAPPLEFAAAVVLEDSRHAARRSARVCASLDAPPALDASIAALFASWSPLPTARQELA